MVTTAVGFSAIGYMVLCSFAIGFVTAITIIAGMMALAGRPK